jgi:outer membrane protein TolC
MIAKPLYALALAVALPGLAAAQGTTPSPAPPAAPAEGGPALQLSLQDAVTRTLENNVDIAVERFNPEQSALNISELKGFYEPILTSAITQSSRQSPATSSFSGAATLDTNTTVYNFGGIQNLPTGGGVRLDFNNNRNSTNNIFTTFNPSFNSSFNLGLSQPFLRNFHTDSTRTQIKVAKKNREISDVQFRQTVVNTVAVVKQQYYDLLYAMDNLEAQRKSLALAGKLLQENEIKVRVGTMAPLDVVFAESEKASREESVILAEAALADAEDALRRSMFNTNDPAVWATRIVPTDRPTAEPVHVDAGAAIQKALAERTDIVAARKGLENADFNVTLAKNQTLPAIDLVASYGTTGLGGTQVLDLTTREPLAVPISGGFGNAICDVFGNDFPTWTIGFNVSYPIFNRQAGAASARAKLSRDQQQANIRRLEMQITQEVRSAVRAVETNYKRVESTRAARVLAERRLDAETKKFGAGMSTNYFVTQSQRDLALAEVAELRAVADYRKSLVNYERVQEAGVGGSGAVTTVSNARSRTTTGGGDTTSSQSQTGGF